MIGNEVIIKRHDLLLLLQKAGNRMYESAQQPNNVISDYQAHTWDLANALVSDFEKEKENKRKNKIPAQ